MLLSFLCKLRLTFENLCIPLLPGSSPPPLLSTTDLEEKIGKVCEEIKMLRMEGKQKYSYLVISREK